MNAPKLAVNKLKLQVSRPLATRGVKPCEIFAVSMLGNTGGKGKTVVPQHDSFHKFAHHGR